LIEYNGERVFYLSVLYDEANEIFLLVDYATLVDVEKYQPGPELVAFLQEQAGKAYEAKADEAGEQIKDLERWVMLKAVNDRWMEHLQTVDYIREGIGLRGYGQVDPLVAYKRETYDTFQGTLKAIRDQAAKTIFLMRMQRQPDYQSFTQELEVNEDEFDSNNLTAEQLESHGLPLQSTVVTTITPTALRNVEDIDWSRVGRNEFCPCGSGKKFKECHYRSLREQGVI